VNGSPEPLPEVKLSNAVRKDVNPDSCRLGPQISCEEVFNSLDGDMICGFGSVLDSIDKLIDAAMNGGHLHDIDAQGMMAVFLMAHLKKIKCANET